MQEDTPHQAGDLFLRQSGNRLQHDYLPKILRCLEVLEERHLWWRPNESSNSIGNLLMHLAGNLRQWIVCGITDETDDRDRDGEFTTRGGATAEDLLARLEETVKAASAVLDTVDVAELSREVHVQGYQTTVLGAVYHAVEHFGGHTGQVIWITKSLTGRDLGFYPDSGGPPEHQPGP